MLKDIRFRYFDTLKHAGCSNTVETENFNLKIIIF